MKKMKTKNESHDKLEELYLIESKLKRKKMKIDYKIRTLETKIRIAEYECGIYSKPVLS